MAFSHWNLGCWDEHRRRGAEIRQSHHLFPRPRKGLFLTGCLLSRLSFCPQTARPTGMLPLTSRGMLCGDLRSRTVTNATDQITLTALLRLASSRGSKYKSKRLCKVVFDYSATVLKREFIKELDIRAIFRSIHWVCPKSYQIVNDLVVVAAYCKLRTVSAECSAPLLWVCYEWNNAILMTYME